MHILMNMNGNKDPSYLLNNIYLFWIFYICLRIMFIVINFCVFKFPINIYINMHKYLHIV